MTLTVVGDVRAARRLFVENRRKHVSKLTAKNFWQILQMLKCGCSMNSIGKSVGVTREAVRGVYEDYFRELFEGKPSGLELMRARDQARTDLSLREKLLLRPALAIVLRAARWHGLESEVAIDADPAQKVLTIKGRRCGVHAAWKCWRVGRIEKDLRYSHFTINRQLVKECDFVILLQILESKRQFYIIPCSHLLKHYPGQGNIVLYAPVGVRRSKLGQKRTVRFECLKYRGAWNLLK